MTDVQTINKPRTVVYASLGLVTGLTNLTITVKAPTGTNPVVHFTEQGLGIYVATYTPTVLGIYQEVVVSASNGDNVMDAYLVVSADTADLQVQLNTMQSTMNKILNAISKGGYIN